MTALGLGLLLALTPLDPAQMAIVRGVQRDRETGRTEIARTKLASLPAGVQRHPIVPTERARLDLAEKKYLDVVRRAGFERRSQRDSLLMDRELTMVGDPPTGLSKYKHSPGYRLILNNVLFPAAERKKQRT